MTITRRLSALEARMAPSRDTESERFGQYVAMSEGISYEELMAEAARIMRAHPGESIDQITAAMAGENGNHDRGRTRLGSGEHCDVSKPSGHGHDA